MAMSEKQTPKLRACGMRRRRSDEYGGIGIEAAEMKTAAEGSEPYKLLGKIRDQASRNWSWPVPMTVPGTRIVKIKVLITLDTTFPPARFWPSISGHEVTNLCSDGRTGARPSPVSLLFLVDGDVVHLLAR
jgi:hypothetical protein